MIDFRLYQKEQAEKGYLMPYKVQVLYESDPQLDKDRLLEVLRKNCGNVEPIEADAGIGFSHTEKLTRVQEEFIPAQSLFSFSDIEGDPIDTFIDSLSQTWDWQETKDAINRVKKAVSISDSLTEGLTRKTRLKLIHDVVLSVLEISNPVALHWLPSQRIVNPARYKEDLTQGGQLFSSAVNVRMFKIENSVDERVMDTMGLTGLGVPDLQCHFVGANPAQIGIFLYSLAEYVFERGDVFRDGDTVDGLAPQQKWRIRKVESYVDPKRKVITVEPGAYAPQQQSEPKTN